MSSTGPGGYEGVFVMRVRSNTMEFAFLQCRGGETCM